MTLACVTGAGIRLGRAIALALGHAGYDVIVHAHTSWSEADAVQRELTALGRHARVELADLASHAEVQALAKRLGPVEVLVNNAGIYEHAVFAELDEARVGRMWAINVSAPFFLTQALLPSLRCVINITDATLQQHASHYSAAKGALQALTRAWAVELAPRVRVNAVAPGPVAVSAHDNVAQAIARVPLAREGTPEDVARAVMYLVTAPYVTGQTLHVDGGLSAL